MYVSGIITSSLSDHYPVFYIFRNVLHSNSDDFSASNIIRYRVVSESTIDALSAGLSNHVFSAILDTNNVDEAFLEFQRILMHYYNISCPIATKNVSYKDFSKP